MNLFLDGILNLGMNLFEIYIIHRYMTIFFDNKYINYKLTLSAYSFRFILSMLLYHMNVLTWMTACISIISIFVISLSYSANLSKKIVVTFVVYLCSFLAEAIVALGIGISGVNPFGMVIQVNSFISILVHLIFWIITLGLEKYKNIKENVPIPKSILFVVMLIFLGFFYLEILIFKQNNIDNMIASVSLICMLITNFVLIYLYDTASKIFQEHAYAMLAVREKNYYHKQTEILTRQQIELKQFRHDIKNRMIAIQEMIKENQKEDALEYTCKLVDKLNKTITYSMTGNNAIDSVINYKFTLAKEKGIDIKSNIVIPKDIRIDEDDIIVILGNAIDNAIEATDYLKKNKYIFLKMEYEKGALFIQIKNSYDSVLNKDSEKLITRKKQKNLHGIGLQNINSIVEKYNGGLEIEHTESEFILNILLYI